jgi:hypothetical protein
LSTTEKQRARVALGSKEERNMPTGRMWDEAREVSRHLGPVDPTPPGFRPEGEKLLARTWAIILAQGLVWISFGVLVLVWPDLGLETLVALIAACALVHGVANWSREPVSARAPYSDKEGFHTVAPAAARSRSTSLFTSSSRVGKSPLFPHRC